MADTHDQTDPARAGRRARRAVARTTAAALALAGAVALLPAGAAGAAPAPVPVRCQTIDFEKATVEPLATTGGTLRHRLTVTGTKPSISMSVHLEPLVYIRQPEYWGIEVIGCSPEIGLPATGTYTATYDFNGTLGTCGVEVIGASATQSFDLVGCTKATGPLDPNDRAGGRPGSQRSGAGVISDRTAHSTRRSDNRQRGWASPGAAG